MPRVRHVSIVSLATLCATAFLLLVIFLTGSLTAFGRQPADFLPAKHAVAVLHSIDASLVEQYRTWIPQLDTLTEEEQHGTIAILILESGSSALVRFTKENLSSTPREFWPYTVHTSSEEARVVLQDRLQSLTTQPGYRDFLRTKKPDQQWVYLTRSALPELDSFYATLTSRLLLQDAEQIGLSNTTIELYQPTTSTQIARLPNAPSEDTILTASAWNMYHLLLPLFEDVLFTSLAQQRFTELFGTSVSLRYSLLPLLQGDTALELRRTSEGQLQIQLAGTHNNEQQLSTILTQLENGRSSLTPQVELLERQLDRQFRMRTLRSDPSAASTDVHTSQYRQSYTLTNDASLLTSSDTFLEIPRHWFLLTSKRRSAGWLDRAKVRALLREMLIEETVTEELPFLPAGDGIVHWLWEQRGPLSVLSLRFEE